MRKAVQAIDTYLNGFGMDAYAEGTVPDNAEFPYITYRLVDPEWHQKTTFFIRVWFRSTRNAELLEVADRITGDIGEGKRLPFDGGLVMIWPESPKVQVMVDPNDRAVRYAYISLSINSYHMPGV